MSALRDFLRGLPEHERDVVWRNSYGEAAAIGDRFGAEESEVRRLCQELEKAATATGFAVLKAWHDAVLIDRRLSATEKVAALRVWSFVSNKHFYAWPSQDRARQRARIFTRPEPRQSLAAGLRGGRLHSGARQKSPFRDPRLGREGKPALPPRCRVSVESGRSVGDGGRRIRSIAE
jgi:hypothetical protein